MERDLIIEDNKKYCYVISYYSQNDYTTHKNYLKKTLLI
jgi:hypothetical protein